MAGIENSKLVVIALCDLACGVDKLANHEGVLSLFQYAQDFTKLGAVTPDALKQEFSDYDVNERQELITLAKSKLVLHNPAIQAKLGEGLDLLNNLVDVGIEVYSVAMKAIADFQKLKDLVTT